MIKFVRFIPLLLLLGAVVYISDADALMLKLHLDRLVDNSDVIVTGKVVDSKSILVDVERSIIHTFVMIDPEESIKGRSFHSPFVVQTPGGCLESGLCMTDPDAAEFSKGEDVLVFLDGSENGFQVYGKFQGKYTIDNGIITENDEPVDVFIARIEETLER